MSLCEQWWYGRVVPESNDFEQMLKPCSNYEGSPGDKEFVTHSLKLQQGTQHPHSETVSSPSRVSTAYTYQDWAGFKCF